MTSLAILLCCVATSAVGATPQRPNIVFILADDLGYGDLGCYGQKRIKTPSIDRLAAEGVRFTQCYAGSTVCAPSRSCLMTGQHTGHTLVRGNSSKPTVSLRKQDVTVAEVLRKAGYATAIFGKWGLGEPESEGTPNRKGFDAWFGFLDQTDAHNYYPAFLHRNEKQVAIEGNANDQKKEYAPDLFTREALAFLDRQKGSDKPFFLYMTYTLPHANNELTRVTGNGMEVPTDEPYSKEEWPQTEKNFAAMVTRLDGDVGKIMARLKQNEMDGNTLVFFTSDNGPHAEGGHKADFFDSNGPLRGTKRDLTEGGIRVPMIARWPGRITPGSVSAQVWAFWDVLPTAAELAGATPPINIDGLSMVNALLGREQKQHGFMYWEFHERGKAQAVRVDDWKAIRPKGKPIELYDLKTDMGEENNVADQHAEVVAKIESILRNARTQSERWPL